MAALFGRECRESRAASVPLLHPHDVEGQKDGHLSDDNVLPNFNLYEAEPHDGKMLSHVYEPEQILNIFPMPQAANAQPNLEDWVPGHAEVQGSTSARRGEPETVATRRR